MIETKQYNCALLVDDDPVSNYINRLVISDIRRIAHAHDAENGVDALKFIQSHCEQSESGEAEQLCPDLIFLDLNMPVMDGFEFLQTYEKLSFKRKDDVKIIVLTSSTNPKDVERVADFNVAAYLNKPLTAESLGAALESL